MEIEKKRGFIINVVYFLILAAFFAVLVKFGLPMLSPFVIAFVIAYLLRRPTVFLTEKMKIPYKPTALLMVLLFYCTAGSLIALLAVRIFAGVRTLVAMLPRLYTVHIEPVIAELFVKFENFAYRMDENLFAMIQNVGDQFLLRLGTFISDLSAKAVGAASNLATAIPGLFVEIVLMVISTFFIAADYDVLKGFCLRQLGSRGRVLYVQIKNYLVGTLFVCIGSYALIATMTFIELSIGLSLVGIEHAVIVAALIAVFDILPVLGTGGIMIPWTVICFLRGQYKVGIGLLLVYVAITVIRNIVEPKIVGSQLGLHPVVTLSSMFVGAQLFGVVGLFGFPIGLSLLRYLNDNGSIHIFKMED